MFCSLFSQWFFFLVYFPKKLHNFFFLLKYLVNLVITGNFTLSSINPIIVLNFQVEGNGNPSIYRSRTKLEIFEDFSVLRASDLKIRIEEMLRIKGKFKLEG